MSVTATKKRTVREGLNQGNPAEIALALQKVKSGNMMSTVKAVVTALTALAAVDITAASVKAAAVITGITLAAGENLPAIGMAMAVRVTASGTAASVGTYILADSAATPLLPPGGANTAVGIASLSADGKTITFPNTVTAFIISYMPRADVSPDATDLQPLS